MTTITLEAIEAKQADIVARQREVDDLIAKLKAQPVRGTTLDIAGIVIELAPGEHYAGAVLNEDGTVKHHLVLMAARPESRLEWGDAMDWAEKAGGNLPSRQEQALLYANCKPHLEQTWHWSCETNGVSYAWNCNFDYGYQNFNLRSYEGSAVAVRRVP